MRYDPERHHRRSLRLKGYDYSRPGAYFVTICTQGRACLFGQIIVGAGPGARPEMVLNDAGRMVQTVWDEIPLHYPGIDVDAFQIMPNHIHGIIIVGTARRRRGSDRTGRPPCPPLGTGRPPCPPIGQPQGQAQGPARTLSLPEVVHRFKTLTTKRYADGVRQWGWPRFDGRLWQRNYYEHIIRDDESLNRIREYIANNPLQWELDRENPDVGAGPCACP